MIFVQIEKTLQCARITEWSLGSECGARSRWGSCATLDRSSKRHLAYQRLSSVRRGRDGEWVGVELDEAIGKNSGSVKGVQLFVCGENCGLFTRAERLVVEPSLVATKKLFTRPDILMEHIGVALNLPCESNTLCADHMRI